MTRLVLTKIAPWPTARILAMMYLAIGIVVMPVMMIAALVAPEANPAGRFGGLVMAFVMPFLYAVIGFLAGVVGSLLYNGLARLLGGIPLTFTPESIDETPAS